MTKISEADIRLYKGGIISTAMDYWDLRYVKKIPLVNTQTATPSSASFVKIPSSILSGFIAKGTTSVTINGGIVCAALAGAVGTASTNIISNSNGSILNKVNVTASGTNEPIKDSGSDAQIWGLFHCASAAADGAAIAANPSENVQLDFVYYGLDGVLVSATVNQAIDFSVNKLYAKRNTPDLEMEGDTPDIDVINGNRAQNEMVLVCTTTTTADVVITMSSGACAGTGAFTVSGTPVLLPASSPLFVSNGKVRGYMDGRRMYKTGATQDITWDSTDSFHCPFVIYAGQAILIEAPESY